MSNTQNTITCSYCNDSHKVVCGHCDVPACETHRADFADWLLTISLFGPFFDRSTPSCGPCHKARIVHAWRALCVIIAVAISGATLLQGEYAPSAVMFVVVVVWWLVSQPLLRDAEDMKAGATKAGARDTA